MASASASGITEDDTDAYQPLDDFLLEKDDNDSEKRKLKEAAGEREVALIETGESIREMAVWKQGDKMSKLISPTRSSVSRKRPRDETM